MNIIKKTSFFIIWLSVFIFLPYFVLATTNYDVYDMPFPPNGNIISKDGIVFNIEGIPVDISVLPGSPSAPEQSRALEEGEISENAIRLKVSAEGFNPKNFTVKTGQVVVLVVMSGDRTHVLRFDDPILKGVAIGISGNEIRGLVFNAPEKFGSYTFYCDVPGHRGRGETGIMHVESGSEKYDFKGDTSLKIYKNIEIDEDKIFQVFPESSLISEDEVVLTVELIPVNNTATPGCPIAPKQSCALSEYQIRRSREKYDIIRVTASATGFSPNKFRVEPGQLVNLVVSSWDRTHVFKFNSILLRGVAIGVAGKESRGISFNAPKEKGIYTFYCDVPGHRGRGEAGEMYVGVDIVEYNVTKKSEVLIPEGSLISAKVLIPEGSLVSAKVLIPEGSLVSEEGEVLTPDGELVDNAALPGSPDAPKQSRSLSEEGIPKEAVQLIVSASGFSPNEFEVKSGDVVTLSVTSADRTHVFKFDDTSLQGLALGIAGEETRAMTFKAPVVGDYTFYCDVPNHRERGETGVMHVVKNSEKESKSIKKEIQPVYRKNGENIVSKSKLMLASLSEITKEDKIEKEIENSDEVEGKNFPDDNNINEIKDEDDVQKVYLEQRVQRLENIVDKIIGLIKTLIEKIF